MFTYKREIEEKYIVDVVVAGGGPAGVAAAVTASECGAKVLLLEKSQCLGGAATLAKVPAFMRFSDRVNFLSGGVGRKVFDTMYGKEISDQIIEYSIDTEKLKVCYDNMILDSGVKVLFESCVIDVEQQKGNVKYCIVKGKEEIYAVSAKIFIDATGDGFLAVKAGADCLKGDDEGHMMPGTLCSFWGDIDWSRAKVELGKDPDNRKLKEAFEDGVFSVKDPSLPGMWRLEGHYGGGNIGHVFGVDGTNEESITNGIIEARRRMKEYELYYRKYLEGYENARVLSTADCLGIRETRRIVCEYMASNDDYFSHATFEDEIGRYAYPMDIHSHSIGSKSKSKYGNVYEKGYEVGKSYGISYRSLLPKNTKNVLVCGRCIGAEREISGSLRVMPCCYITGMAAGAAAAIAIVHQYNLREIPNKILQNKLLELGAYLPNVK